ncbi:MAG TPA: hypothetical protein VGK02_01590 [Candidatus Aquicultor sp.]|jgi:hypothetical protein
MKVRELQQELSKLDPELEVICYSEDDNLLEEGMGFRLLDIEAVNTTQGERVRLDDRFRTPYLKLGKSPHSEIFAVIEVTSVF